MKINFPPDFKEFIELLEKNKVEYLIIGGYAVGYHGYPRFTGDLDIWLKVSAENAQKIETSINEFGFGSLGLTATDFMVVGNIIQIGYPPLRIDLLNDIDGVSFDESYVNKVRVDHDGFSYNIIGYDDLIKNKKATNRGKDKGDVENLEK
jgi:predicted nucleotidyltransferase